jgi:hypothetical protein
MHIRDERSHLFFQIFKLFVVRSFAHGIIIISCPLILLLIIIFVLIVVLVGFFSRIFVVRPGIEAPSEAVILNLPSLSGFHVPCVINVRLCLCVRLPNLRLRLILGPGGLGLGLGLRVQLDLTLIVRLDELSNLMFEGGDLR